MRANGLPVTRSRFVSAAVHDASRKILEIPKTSLDLDLPPPPPEKPVARPVPFGAVDASLGILGKDNSLKMDITNYSRSLDEITKLVESRNTLATKGFSLDFIKGHYKGVTQSIENAFAHPAQQICDKVTVPSSSVIIDGTHSDEIPIDQSPRAKTDEDVPPFPRDKYGERTPESLHSPKGKFAENRQSLPGRPVGSKLLSIIRSILTAKTPQVHPPLFRFEPSVDAARHNFQVFQAHDMDIDAALSSGPFSPTSFGSEFRPTETLAPLYSCHPTWPKMRSILDFGTSFPMEEIDEETRQKDLSAALIRGNHSSAKGEKANILVEKTLKEISNGWCLPLLVEHAASIPGAMYSPMGIAEQATINERGEFIPKDRQVHDQSFKQAVSHESVNSLVNKDALASCLYGHMLRRLIHSIVGCRLRNPTSRILISKADIDSAYRRSHTNGKAAAKSLMWIMIGGIKLLIMCLRLTFGGSPCPSEWTSISEPVTDLANAILKCNDWDPDELSSDMVAMYPPTKLLPDSIPFAPAQSVIVNLPNDDKGKVECFIDDDITIGIDDGSKLCRNRLIGCVPLALEATARPISIDEPLPRTLLLKKTKIIAEGGLEETKTVLGWHLNTRTLTIALPDRKFTAWSSTIQHMIDTGTTTSKTLETMIGRQTHAANILPMARHFICRIRFAHSRMHVKNFEYRLSKWVLEDLQLALEILQMANTGVSMNLLTFRLPRVGYFVDAAEHGLGGWNSWGAYWLMELPDHLLGRAHINLLEFLAALIGPWIDILHGRLSPEDCFLVMGDSTTAAGWIHSTRFKGKDEDDADFNARLMVARKFARLVLNHKLVNYSQWFPGKDNVVADVLSRDGHLSKSDRETLLTSFFPSQLPPNFHHTVVPEEITSFVSSVLQTLPHKKRRFLGRKRTGYVPGVTGSSSFDSSAFEAMNIWRLFPDPKNTNSSSPTPLSSETVTQREAALKEWLLAQSEMPSAMWLRDSSQLDSLIHDTM